MNLDNSNIFGIGALITITLLGAYLIILQIREFTSEKPDPKLTYLPKAEYESRMSELHSRLDELTHIVHQNAQQIAALSAQTQIILQRINEFSTKLDRIQECKASKRFALAR